jgi:hypothetical protein
VPDQTTPAVAPLYSNAELSAFAVNIIGALNGMSRNINSISATHDFLSRATLLQRLHWLLTGRIQ